MNRIARRSASLFESRTVPLDRTALVPGLAGATGTFIIEERGKRLRDF